MPGIGWEAPPGNPGICAGAKAGAGKQMRRLGPAEASAFPKRGLACARMEESSNAIRKSTLSLLTVNSGSRGLVSCTLEQGPDLFLHDANARPNHPMPLGIRVGMWRAAPCCGKIGARASTGVIGKGDGSGRHFMGLFFFCVCSTGAGRTIQLLEQILAFV